MTKEEFLDIIEARAAGYAEGSVYEPEEHEDAVETIIYDYVEGARAAYTILTGKEFDD